MRVGVSTAGSRMSVGMSIIVTPAAPGVEGMRSAPCRKNQHVVLVDRKPQGVARTRRITLRNAHVERLLDSFEIDDKLDRLAQEPGSQDMSERAFRHTRGGTHTLR